MNKAFLAIPLALAAAPAHAQPAAPVSETIVAGTDSASARMTVPVSIGGVGPFPFVVDTGAERTVISRELANRLALNDSGSARVHSMTGTATVDTVLIPSLQVSARSITDIRAPALQQQHLGADGLIGIDSLRDQQVTLDFKAGTMKVMPGERSTSRRDPDEIVVTARRKAGQLVLTNAMVNGVRVNVVIDTGSQVSVGNSSLQRRLLGRTDSRLKPIEILSVTGGRADAQYTSVREIKLGGATIRNMPIAFANAPIFKTLDLNDRPAMMLGMDALRMFDRVSVDFANRKVRLLLPDGASRDMRTRLAAQELRPPSGV